MDPSGLRFRASASSKGRSSANLISEMSSRSDRGVQVKENVQNWAASDDPKKKTPSRKFVEKYLMNYKWYYPNKDRSDMPNLKEGWAFYEHVTLARHKVTNNSSSIKGDELQGAQLKRALPGDSGDTELYNYFSTPESSLKDWGVGVALYFSTLRVYALALFVAGLCALRNILYFNTDDYDERESRGILWIMRGSAVCNDREWLECEDGFCDIEKMRDIGVTYATHEDGQVFVQRLNCPHSDTNDNDILKAGLCDLATICVLILITLGFSWFQSKQQTILDEDQITASDYSIRVLNPPEKAYDPDEWRDFFNAYDGEKGVTAVTIILNNSILLNALKQRRYFRKELQRRIPDAKLDDPDLLNEQVQEKTMQIKNKKPTLMKRLFHCCLRPILRLPFINKYLDPEVLVEKIKQRTELIEEELKKDFDVASVIVTFESEEGKRTAMSALQASTLSIKTQDTSKRQEDLFRGKILDIVEPSEPSALRYLTINVPFTKRVIQFSITFAITVGLIVLSALLVAKTRKDSGSFWAGVLTTTLNIIIPFIVRLLLLIEQHAREDTRQRSMYIKVTLFRWVNTAITTKFIVPFTDTLGTEKDDLLIAINGILLAEMWLSPLLASLDIMGNLSKHYYAPRATVTEQLFLCFKGTNYNLADKYTDMTKIVFVCYYYSSLNPSLLFLGAVVLIVRYSVDKFCLLRLWGAAPNIGTQVADFSRKYFLSAAIVFGTVVSAYDWALFNFDRVCIGAEGETRVEPETFSVQKYDKSGDVLDDFDIEISSSEMVRVCNEEECCQEVGFKFPPIPSNFQTEDFKWMTPGHEMISYIFGWFSVFVLVMFFLFVFGHTIYSWLKSFFVGGYDVKDFGQDQQIDFSNTEVDAYIPQINEPIFAYPLITCDIDDVPQHLLGFQVPGSLDDYNVMFDVPHEGMKRTKKIEGNTSNVSMLSQHPSYEINDHNENERHIFDTVKYWPHGGL